MTHGPDAGLVQEKQRAWLTGTNPPIRVAARPRSLVSVRATQQRRRLPNRPLLRFGLEELASTSHSIQTKAVAQADDDAQKQQTSAPGCSIGKHP